MNASKPFVIGLTGSIGMGKSTTAAIFAEFGADIWDADAAVNRLYAKGGAGVAAIQAIRAQAVDAFAVNKEKLKEWIKTDETALSRVENVIHPLVAADRKSFLNSTKADIVVLDIPLLFETDQQGDMDLICVVSTSSEVQRQRVLARPGMTENQFEMILAKQMPDAEKRAKADVVVPTGSLEDAKQAVQDIMDQIRKNRKDA